MRTTGGIWSYWLLLIVFILITYIYSVDAGCGNHRKQQIVKKNHTKDWGPDGDLSGSYEEFFVEEEEVDGNGIHLGGRFVGGSYDNSLEDGSNGFIDFTATRGRCKREGGVCLTNDQYCRGHRKLYQTECDNECICCYPDHELDYSGHNIVLVKQLKTWKCARDICRDKGGDLFVPKSVEAMIRFLRDKHLYKKKVWLGINDFKKARTYEGVHGNKVTGGWERGQPRRKDPGQDCVAAEDYSRKFKGIKVRPCLETYFFVCDLGNNHASDHDVGA